MKKTLLLIALLSFSLFSFSQVAKENLRGKGSYNILKFDALNLMGIGVQKVHLAYEFSPMKANENNFPTIQFNLTAPFNSLNHIDMNYGLEGGAELRFYQRRKNREQLSAEGFYLGVGLDGGFTSFTHLDQYYSSGVGTKEVSTDYERIRTGIYFLLGAQTKLGEKLFFDVNVGMGWSNVSVKPSEAIAEDPQWTKEDLYYNGNPFFSLYRDGKYQGFYMPVSFGIGYNFATE